MVNVRSVDDVEVANRLRPVLLKLARELRKEGHHLGVTGSQVSLLVHLWRNPGVGVRELAALEGVSAAAMSAHVRRLEEAGLVERSPSADDPRRHALVVTAEGENVLRSVKRRRTAWLAARLAGLDPGDVQAIDAAVEPLARLLAEGE